MKTLFPWKYNLLIFFCFVFSLSGKSQSIPGHGNVASSNDLRRSASYFTDLRKGVQEEIVKGKSFEDIKKSLVIQGYDDFGFLFFRQQNIEAVYKELLKQN